MPAELIAQIRQRIGQLRRADPDGRRPLTTADLADLLEGICRELEMVQQALTSIRHRADETHTAAGSNTGRLRSLEHFVESRLGQR